MARKIDHKTFRHPLSQKETRPFVLETTEKIKLEILTNTSTDFCV